MSTPEKPNDAPDGRPDRHAEARPDARPGPRPEGRPLTFEFRGQRVGYFEGIEAYPIEPGKYRYMPYRGLGHFNMIEECTRQGLAHCTFIAASTGTMGFVARPSGEYGVLDVSEIAPIAP